jgi:tetratricopeptide (TPR) repeat protein
MGVVYRGAHVETGEPVAVKTVNVVAESMLASLRREIHALGRVRHRGVVRIVQQGVTGGLPWYAMELLQGETLRDHLARLAGRPVPRPGPMLALLQRLCEPLAAVHAEGIVHRDLKPENIFIRTDGTPVLVDFGFAQFGARHGREALEVGGAILGSAPYMAPEQIRGDFVDARADLYALGCILYEALTGRPPFVSAEGRSSIAQRFLGAPVPPSERVGGVPAALDALVLRLLEKRPEDRPGYADDVAAALASVGAGGAPARPRRLQAYLFRPGFSGRTQALVALMERMDQARRGEGGQLFVSGESGVGKTRLVVEMAIETARRGDTVITGECIALEVGVQGQQSGRAAPLHPFRPLLLALADRCRAHGPAEIERLLGERGPVLAEHEPMLAELPGVRERPAPAPLPPPEAKARLLAALRDTLIAFARLNPVLLILDDLQWADELSLELLQALGEGALSGHPVLILGTFRLDEMSEPLRRLVHATGATTLQLDRLDRASVEEMVRGMLALREPPLPLVDFLVEHSSGTPFFIAEYLRAAISEGMLYRDRAGAWRLEEGEGTGESPVRLGLPRSLAELIDRRLQSLDEGSRAWVRWASVLGREFDVEQVAALAALGAETSMEVIQRLRLRQILEDVRASRLRFVHDKLREVAYQRIPPEERPVLHRRAAELLEQWHAGTAELAMLSPQLASHWARALDHDRAAHWFGRAGDQARAAYATGQAIAFYQAGIAELEEALRHAPGSPAPRDEALFALQESLGKMLALTGRPAEARGVFERALALRSPDDPLARARLRRFVGQTWQAQHQREEAVRAYAAAEEVLGPPPPRANAEAWWREWVQLQSTLASFHYREQGEEMRLLVERAQRTLEGCEPHQHLHLLRILVHAGMREERFLPSEKTVGYMRACLAATEELADSRDIADAQVSTGVVLLLTGDPAVLPEVSALLRTALEMLERVQDVGAQARALTYLALLHRRLGEVEEVRSLGQKGLAVATRGKVPDHVGASQANLAWVAWRERHIEEAVQGCLAALESWSRGLSYPLHWLALFPLMAIDLERGRIEDAISRARMLLRPEQQRLPDELARPLASAREARDRGGADFGREALEEAARAARRLGYL